MPPTVKANGFRRIANAIQITGDNGGVLVHKQDFSRMFTIMCEGSSREELEAFSRVVGSRRSAANDRRFHMDGARDG